MTVRADRPVFSKGNRKILSGRFRPNGGGAVDNTLNVGKGFTVTQGAAGVFSVVTDFPVTHVFSITPSLWLNARANVDVKVGAISISSTTGLLTFALLTQQSSDGTTAVDIASNANNWITFDITFRQMGSD